MHRRLEALDDALAGTGLHWACYSPGDGVTRWRLIPNGSTYFGPASGVLTVLGAGTAEAVTAGIVAALAFQRREGAR